ncbi:dnaJ homolog subfamily C member 28 [Anopheles aquasalis]|uniref:dnaJ homolog subfamily C member 28 n=1 Tax=Anopheles aquasalis TaxID=42839 RepID=UPI00215A896B|nr:dnaJ homolog subfamily C member 28 [Anopheles aquasalis]XP_050087724.1 dnaJ homolog subfamily C member 28 [Anopheles aquasalis]
MLAKHTLIVTPRHYLRWSVVRYNHTRRGALYNKCYQLLGVNENSDQNTVRQAYLSLVKRLHPDSGHPEASAERFQEVDTAFRVLQEKFAKARRGIVEDLQEQVKVYDIKHTAPQHRQYLSFDGIGYGTPAQRQKQYQAVRASRAQERVLEHRLSKAQASESALMKKGDYFKKHEIKTKYGYDRVVEDLIQEAISRGDFSNLSGFGKPLPDHQSQNPYVDFTTHKINKILLDNGFTPEWITLHKDLREATAVLREELTRERAKLGPAPLGGREEQQWEKLLEEYRPDESRINKMIDKFNLIVPMLNKQMVRLNLDRIAAEILATGPVASVTTAKRTQPTADGSAESTKPAKNSDSATNKSSLLGFIGSLFG